MKTIDLQTLLSGKNRRVKVALTLVLALLVLILGARLWNYYMSGPWTRDGRVRADVVVIAPDVSGLITEVDVGDNQFVKAGDVLFKVDPVRFEQALAQAESLVDQRQAEFEIRRRQAKRRASLDDQVISRENRDDSTLEEKAAQARLNDAIAQRDLARTNLERTQVRASVDGWITNLNLYPGEYVQSGQASLSLINANSFWVYGYFEENRIPAIHIGDAATVTLMGTDIVLHGQVESVASGIVDRDNASVKGDMANVNPSFSWVRLAQRVPVRIRLDEIPTDIRIASGMSCSISIKPD